MNKGSVPTAIAALVVIAICFAGYMTIKYNVEKYKEKNLAEEASQIGDLPKIRVSINGKTYIAKLESNKAAKSFLENLPLSITMKKNDNYSKKGYTYVKLTSAAYKQKQLYAGDIVLSGQSEVILFCKDFKPSDKYSLIGHIDKFEYIDSDEITVNFNKPD